jgi:hypothetical protein
MTKGESSKKVAELESRLAELKAEKKIVKAELAKLRTACITPGGKAKLYKGAAVMARRPAPRNGADWHTADGGDVYRGEAQTAGRFLGDRERSVIVQFEDQETMIGTIFHVEFDEDAEEVHLDAEACEFATKPLDVANRYEVSVYPFMGANWTPEDTQNIAIFEHEELEKLPDDEVAVIRNAYGIAASLRFDKEKQKVILHELLIPSHIAAHR